MNTIKKLVTDMYGSGTEKHKEDIGFQETISWYSCGWTRPRIEKEDGSTEVSVIHYDGTRGTLHYGPFKHLIIDMLNNYGECEGIKFIDEEYIDSVDSLLEKAGGWDSYVWYEVCEWSDYDWMHYDYVIYRGDYKPLYFAEEELKRLPDLSEVDEVYL